MEGEAKLEVLAGNRRKDRKIKQRKQHKYNKNHKIVKQDKINKNNNYDVTEKEGAQKNRGGVKGKRQLVDTMAFRCSNCILGILP